MTVGHTEASRGLGGQAGRGPVKPMHLHEGTWAGRRVTPTKDFFQRPNLDTTYTNTCRKDYLGTGHETVGWEWE